MLRGKARTVWSRKRWVMHALDWEILLKVCHLQFPSRVTWGLTKPKLWYPKTALTPRFHEPFAPFRPPAESGHGIMIGFSFIYRFIKSGIQTFRGLPPLLCHNDGGAICANCIANSAGYSAVARLTDHPITGLLIGLSLFGIKLG